MTDQINMQKLAEETQQKSMVIIEFESIGSSEFRIYRQNVTPSQVLGALQILELSVKNWYISMENERMQREREQHLSVPKPEILIPK